MGACERGLVLLSHVGLLRPPHWKAKKSLFYKRKSSVSRLSNEYFGDISFHSLNICAKPTHFHGCAQESKQKLRMQLDPPKAGGIQMKVREWFAVLTQI